MKPDPRYTRVTEILWPFSSLQHVDEHVLENAARRGTRVHAACEAIVSGEGAWDPEPELAGYIHSFEQWWNLGHTVLSMEERFYDDDMLITGQCDLIIAAPDDTAIILDIKTSAKPSKTWPLQGAAYAYLARKAGYNITGIQFLQVNRHGMDPTVYSYDDDWEMFEHCYHTYNRFFRKSA